METILLCGISVFLPHARENDQIYKHLHIKIELFQHGVSQIGPVGAKLAEIENELSKSDVITNYVIIFNVHWIRVISVDYNNQY